MKVVIIGDVHLSESTPRSWVADYSKVTLDDFISAISLGDIAIVLGDLFHTPVVSEAYKLEIVRRIRGTGKIVWTIWGNHDVDGLNMGAINKTSMNLLGSFGVIGVMPEGYYKVEGVDVCVLPLKKNPQVPVYQGQNDSIMLGHLFFESSLDKEFSVTKEQVFNSNFKLVFLGHDHEPYQDIKSDTTCLVRLGSLCRNTSHLYNLNRIPEVAILELDKGKILSYERKQIPTLSGTQIFRADVFDKPVKNRLSSLMDISDILQLFDSNKKEALTVRKALNDLATPAEVVEYIEGVYERAGIRL